MAGYTESKTSQTKLKQAKKSNYEKYVWPIGENETGDYKKVGMKLTWPRGVWYKMYIYILFIIFVEYVYEIAYTFFFYITSTHLPKRIVDLCLKKNENLLNLNLTSSPQLILTSKLTDKNINF